MARVVATEGWANLLLGLNNCESPKTANGEIVGSVEMFNLAVPLLTRAATIAKAANSATYERFAIAGRALANLYAGNLNDALIASTADKTAKLKALLGIPAHVAVAAIMPFGRPVKQLTKLKRKPVAEFAMRERWGGAPLGG